MDNSQQIAKYAAKVGHDAAVTRSRMDSLQMLMLFFMTITMMLLFSSVALKSLGLRDAFYFSLVPLLVGVIGRFWLRHLYLRQASKALGVRVSPLHDVPLSDRQYELWCQKHGVSQNAMGPGSD
jgi:hypothetical protein